MKAMLIDDNQNLVWSEVPYPAMGEEEAIVKIHAAALNRADLLQRQGKYPSPPGCPEWMGLEIAGIIVEMGEEAKEKSSCQRQPQTDSEIENEYQNGYSRTS